MIKYRVNENCIGCGLCAGICPEVFSMTDEGVATAIETEVPAENEPLQILPSVASSSMAKRYQRKYKWSIKRILSKNERY